MALAPPSQPQMKPQKSPGLDAGQDHRGEKVQPYQCIQADQGLEQKNLRAGYWTQAHTGLPKQEDHLPEPEGRGQETEGAQKANPQPEEAALSWTVQNDRRSAGSR